MPMFTERPKRIEARYMPQGITGNTQEVLAIWMALADWCGGKLVLEGKWTRIILKKRNGQVVSEQCNPGDWVIKLDDNDFTSMKDSEFKRKYEYATNYSGPDWQRPIAQGGA